MSIVNQALTAELTESMTLSVKYGKEIQNAKTNTKKAFLARKLRKNNLKVADLVQALDRLHK